MDTWPLYLIAVATAVALYRLETLQRGVLRLNRQIDLLTEHFKVQVEDALARRVQALLRDGKKIDAIQCYQYYTGANLATAKAAVERLGEGAGPA